MSPARTPVWRKLLLSVSVLVALLLGAEGLAGVWLAAHVTIKPPRLTEQVHCVHDAQLGWRNLPDVQRPDIYGPGISLTTNGRGFRALEEHTAEVPEGRYRVVCLGDSFTMGYGVDDLATYPAQMQHFCPTLQTVNMGLGGYGLDQDYLWYVSDGTALQADLLLFAFIDTDFTRLGMDSFVEFPKPRIDLEGDALVVRNVPVPRGWTSGDLQPSAWSAFVDALALSRLWSGPMARLARPPPKSAEQLQHTLTVAGRIFDALAELSARRGQRFVLVYLPTIKPAGNVPTPTASWVRSYAAASGVPLVDLDTALSALPRGDIPRYFLPDKHLSATGNAFVARALLAELARRVEGFPACDG